MKPLTQKKILGYAIGDLGINLNFQLIGFYLAYFYTDVFGISPWHVGTLFLVARVWDAVNDPLMGYIADHTNTKRGRFRPYLLFGAVPLNLVLLACYFTPDLSETAKVVYAYVVYILHGMLFTAVGLPYSSISAVMTQDQQERAVISTYRMFFAVIVALSIVAIAVKPFVALFETEQQGFAVAAGIFAVVSTALLWIAYGQSEERVQVARQSYHLRDIGKVIAKNRMLTTLAVAMFLNTGVWVVGNAVAAYYFKYVLGNEAFMPTFFVFMLVANLVGALLTPWLTQRFGKRDIFMLGSVVVALLYGGRFFVPGGALTIFVIVSMVGSVGQMMCSITQWGMLPDTVEYGQWATGIRSEGIPFAFFSFMQKLGMAVAGAVAAYALDWVGYAPNRPQTSTALLGIESLFNLVPAAFSLMCLVTLFFYRLDGALYARILRELTAHQAGNGPPPAAGEHSAADEAR